LAFFSFFTLLLLAWRRESSLLPITNTPDIDLASKTTIFYIWHVITLENLIFDVAFIARAFYKGAFQNIFLIPHPCLSNLERDTWSDFENAPKKKINYTKYLHFSRYKMYNINLQNENK